MIRMYWWQGGGGHGNFGDKLGPALAYALSGQRIEYAPIEKSDLVAVGSVLEPWFWANQSWHMFSGHIWGAGRMFGKLPISFPRARITALRGRLTIENLSESRIDGVAIGDPGLLCGYMPYSKCQRRFKLGLWPHWSETRHPLLCRLAATSSDILMIDPCGGVLETLSRAASCEAIAASSLHGLITADALAIPNCWLRLNTGKEDAVGMPRFKYLDYFSTFQAPAPRCKAIGQTDSLDTLLKSVCADRLPEVGKMQQNLLAAFPYARI